MPFRDFCSFWISISMLQTAVQGIVLVSLRRACRFVSDYEIWVTCKQVRGHGCLTDCIFLFFFNSAKMAVRIELVFGTWVPLGFQYVLRWSGFPK